MLLFSDLKISADGHEAIVPFKIINMEGKPGIQVKINNLLTKVFSPEEINAMILWKKIKILLLIINAYFNDAQWQRRATNGMIVGLNVAGIIKANVDIVYGLDKNGSE